jgi:hypothetical protein
MRKVLSVLAVSALLFSTTLPLFAHDEATVKGEVIDLKCYTSQGVKATGSDHADCALTCAKNGNPVGILTSDGEVYTITGEYTKNKNEKLWDYVAKQVEAKGVVTEKDGKKMLDVKSLSPAS